MSPGLNSQPGTSWRVNYNPMNISLLRAENPFDFPVSTLLLSLHDTNMHYRPCLKQIHNYQVVKKEESIIYNKYPLLTTTSPV